MESALIVSASEDETFLFAQLLNAASVNNIAALTTCAEARRLLLEREVDLVVINAPLKDETGEVLARNIATKGFYQVILAVKNEHFYETTSVCGAYGILTVAKPLHQEVFWAALALAESASNLLKAMQKDNRQLKQKMEDIRLIDRAKWFLITAKSFSEQAAHRYIEKRAMDLRTTKRAVAEDILKNFGNY